MPTGQILETKVMMNISLSMRRDSTYLYMMLLDAQYLLAQIFLLLSKDKYWAALLLHNIFLKILKGQIMKSNRYKMLNNYEIVFYWP